MPSAVEVLDNPLPRPSARSDLEIRVREHLPERDYDSPDLEPGERDAETECIAPVSLGEEESFINHVVAATTPGPGEPIPGYLRLSVPEILEYVRNLDTAAIRRVVTFEKAHRNRKTLLIKLGRMIRPPKAREDHTLPQIPAFGDDSPGTIPPA